MDTKNFADKTEKLTKQITEFAHHTSYLEMARESDSNITAIMQMMLNMKAEDRKGEQRRIDREEERQAEDRRREDIRREEKLRRREEELKREERLMIALTAAQPAVPQTVTILNHKLPEMKDSEEIEIFVSMFEAALRTNYGSCFYETELSTFLENLRCHQRSI